MRPVNLVPSEHRAQATGAQSGSAYVIVGVLALLLGVVAFYVITTNHVNQRKADAAEAKAQADALETRASQLASFTSFSSIKQTRLASVRSTADGRFDWERMMRELSRVIPSGTWLMDVDGSTGSSPTDQDAAGAAPGDDSAPTVPTAQLTGCAPSQTDVARMMTRIREMHAVSDVGLTDSSRGDDSGGGTEGCKAYQFNVTVTFGATNAKEAPRGQKRVPASLGGGK